MLETALNDQTQIIQTVAHELATAPDKISAAVALLDDGATVPFIARYRKEATGGLDDITLRKLEVRLQYLRELAERRLAILSSIEQAGKLTPELAAQIAAADTKQRLEDLYAPYKPKRRTRAQIAREAGIEPLAQRLLTHPAANPENDAEAFLNPEAGFTDAKTVLDGARDILAEQWAEDASLVAHMRGHLEKQGWLYSTVVEGKETEGANFRDWFNFTERLQTLPSHRVLALLRGRKQGFLDLRLGLDPEQNTLTPHPCVLRIAQFLNVAADFSSDASSRAQWLAQACRWTWRVKLLPAFETELFNSLREAAEEEAIRVFSANLKDLLLASPAGPKTIMGLDPGIRTGVKVAVISQTGKALDTATIYPFAPRNDEAGALATLDRLITHHAVNLIAIGNGTGSRETEQLVRQLNKQQEGKPTAYVTVSEAGASVYSASELASQEFPDLDVSVRSAISIARRLQDPLAELVKIDPKAIGVGQYQHDVNQNALARSLDTVIEDCVNAVGVDVNTASAALLSHVSGLSASLAANVVAWRDENGAFKDREQLRKVKRFGEKTFEQAAGFLRIANGNNPLDASAVHPEAYPVVQRILDKIAAGVSSVIGKTGALASVSPEQFTDERFGLPTVKDIFAELEKPGRDPRPEFRTIQYKEGVHSLNDLKEGMVLEGSVTNVANFGAFVDIGVHQDGLVHISALADSFVKDPRDVVRVGQTVQVKVIEVDLARKRIALSMRLNDSTAAKPASTTERRGPRGSQNASRAKTANTQKPAKKPAGAMAEAFARLKK